MLLQNSAYDQQVTLMWHYPINTVIKEEIFNLVYLLSVLFRARGKEDQSASHLALKTTNLTRGGERREETSVKGEISFPILWIVNCGLCHLFSYCFFSDSDSKWHIFIWIYWLVWLFSPGPSVVKLCEIHSTLKCKFPSKRLHDTFAIVHRRKTNMGRKQIYTEAKVDVTQEIEQRAQQAAQAGADHCTLCYISCVTSTLASV